MVLGLILASASCAPAQKTARAPGNPPQKIAPQKAVIVPEIAAEAPRRLLTTVSGLSIEGVSFDSRTHRLQVLDQVQGPASKWP
ncbi:MAG: hypothetical protein CFE26_15940, partial [Verrucomicrobiales bacterium VVV1]